jgi:uncharacterized lipoprotein YmbA
MNGRFHLARGAVWLIPLAALLGLSGCFSLGREEPTRRHYVLGGDRVRDAAPELGGLHDLTVGVRRLRLSSYLEPPLLAVRHGANRVTYAEFHRWSEPLDGGINRAVAASLSSRATLGSIDVAPWSTGAAHDFLIQLHVQRFEGLAPDDPAATEGEVYMLAAWEIIRPRDGAILARGTTDHRRGGWRVGDHAGMVKSLDVGVEALATDLLASLASLAALRTTGATMPSPPRNPG